MADSSILPEGTREESMNFSISVKALTESGSYHFQACHEAFCEFIDNSIQATLTNKEHNIKRNIVIHIYTRQKAACIFDNGGGMTPQELNGFANYFFTQADRGNEPQISSASGFIDGNISKFGVGAKQAGFYLADTIKVITKTRQSPEVLEFSMSKEELHRREKNSEEVYKGKVYFRKPGDKRKLQEDEEYLKNLIEEERCHESFTMIVLKKVYDKHIAYFVNDSCKNLAENLSHVYHFYLHGLAGISNKLKLGGIDQSDVENSQNSIVSMVLHLNGNEVIQLNEYSNILWEYEEKLKSVFPFSLKRRVEENEDRKIQGCIMYFPIEFGEETLPRQELEINTPEKTFHCFWQGRLTTWSDVSKLEYFVKPNKRSLDTKDRLPDICYSRFRGLLFFDWSTPVLHNKQGIMLDTGNDLSDALSEVTSSTKRTLKRDFQIWLKKCHSDFDEELFFDDIRPKTEQPNNGDVLYGSLTIMRSNKREEYKRKDNIRIGTKPVVYGRINHFIKKEKQNEVALVNYCILPENVYGGKCNETPFTRIRKPDENTMNKYLSSEQLLLPTSIKISNSESEINSAIELLAGDKENMKKKLAFRVSVYNGKDEAIVAVHHRKISVQVETYIGQEKDDEFKTSSNDGKEFSFKYFQIKEAGVYKYKFIILVDDKPSGVEDGIEIRIKPNVAKTVNLENVPKEIHMGDSPISFTLSFFDAFENNTNLIEGNLTLTCECVNINNGEEKLMKINGFKEKYRPNVDGKLEVSNIGIEPYDTESILSDQCEFRVKAEGIGTKSFPLKLLPGPPERAEPITQLNLNEFKNFDSFPQFEVRILDKWNQITSLEDKTEKLALMCKAFQEESFTTVSGGIAKFSHCPVKVEKMKNPITEQVKIAIVTTKLCKKKGMNEKIKPKIKEIVKDLYEFEIHIAPSQRCQAIQILKEDTEINNNELDAIADTVIKNLKVVGFSETGKRLTDAEFLAQNPQVMPNWGEIDNEDLPNLPNYRVPRRTDEQSEKTVRCLFSFNDIIIKLAAKLKVNVKAGTAKKWSFQYQTLEVRCDQNRDLKEAIKIVTLDEYDNVTSPLQDTTPTVTVKHDDNDKHVEYLGELVQNGNDFCFTNDSVIKGHSGKITLYVNDVNNQCTNASISIELLSGDPSKLNVTCDLFELNDENEPVIKVYPKDVIPAPITCSLTDACGNQSPTKVPLNVSWKPNSAGKSLTKIFNDLGVVTFQKNEIKCYENKGKVEMKIAVDMPNIKPVLIHAQMKKRNVVTKVNIEIKNQHLNADSKFPFIEVTHETEDGVQVPDFKSRLSLFFQKPSEEEFNNATTIYPVEKWIMENETLIITPGEEFELEEAGAWIFQCIYTEKRQQLKKLESNSKVESNKCQISVFPGNATHLNLTLPSENILHVNNNTAEGRILLPPPSKAGSATPVPIYAVDKHKNRVLIKGKKVELTIEAGDEEIDVNNMPELHEDCLSFTMKGKDPCVPEIKIRDKKGCQFGYYYLKLSLDGVEPYKIKFKFTTNEEAEKISQEKVSLEKEISDSYSKFDAIQTTLEDRKKDKQLLLKSLKSHVRTNLAENLNTTTINENVHTLQRECEKMETSQHVLRECKKDPSACPRDEVQQYIKGQVFELAYVSDDDICRILSWYAQDKMKFALCEQNKSQRMVYNLGFPAYSEESIVGFPDHNSGENDKLQIPEPPKDFGKNDFAVNLLEFADGKNLRATLFYSIFGKTTVVENLDAALQYRSHLMRGKLQCPDIITLTGELLAADGSLDPQKKCPKLDELSFTFGQLPAKQTPEYKDLESAIENLTLLEKLIQKIESLDQEVKECRSDYENKEKMNAPKIKKLEEEELNLKQREDDYWSPSPSKKRKL